MAANTLVDLLITQQRPAEAFRWLNRFSTTDLADYGRLTDVQVADPEAQRALSAWRQQQNALQARRQRLDREPNERQLQQLVEQEAAQNRAAEALIRRYPVIAELLETRPADIERLQAGIPAGTVAAAGPAHRSAETTRQPGPVRAHAWLRAGGACAHASGCPPT